MGNADGSIIIKTIVDVDQSEKDLAKLKGKIQKTESEIEELSRKKAEAGKQSIFSAAELDAEKAKLVEMKRNLQEMREIARDTTLSPSVRNEAKAQIPQQRQDIADQQARVGMLQREYNKLYNSVEKYEEQIASAKITLEQQTEEAGELAQKINSVSKASQKMAEAQKKAEKNARKFGLRLKEVLRSALVFTLITQSLAKFREWVGKVLKTNDKAKQSIARLKGALLTLAQPLVEIIIPSLIVLADAFTKIFLVLARLFALISGSTLEESKKSAEALNKETEALEGVGNAADDAAKSMASFDEINKIGKDSGGNSDAIAPSFDFSNENMSENAGGLAGAIAAIGAAFLTWKISDSVLGWFDKLGEGKFNNAHKVSAGLAGIAASFGLMSWHYSQLSSGELDPNSIKSAIVSAIETAFFAIGGAAMLSVLGVSFGTGIIITLPIGIALTNLVIELSDEQGQAAVHNLKRAFEGIFSGEDWGSITKDFVFGPEDEKTFWEKISDVFSGTSPFNIAQKNLIDAIKRFGSEDIVSALDINIGGRIKKWMLGEFPGLFNENGAKETAKESLFKFIDFITNPLGYWLETKLKDPVKEALRDIWEEITGWFRDIKIFNPNVTGFGPDYSWMFKSSASVASVPGLANGSVVPPNRKFLAVLGDNKTETEVVSPLSTMKQAVMEAMRESGTGNKQTTIVLTGEMAALARVLRPYIEDEGHRVGVSIVTK